MGMNNTPASDRIHIGFFGRRNAGKSSVLNAVTGQDLAVVSDVKGTTTDPVYKAMELVSVIRNEKNCIVSFFNDTATTEIYTLSLHDALPIWYSTRRMWLCW